MKKIEGGKRSQPVHPPIHTINQNQNFKRADNVRVFESKNTLAVSAGEIALKFPKFET